MKMYFKLLFLIFIFLFFLSCSDTLVVGTVWKGDFKYYSEKYDLEVYFTGNKGIEVFLKLDFDADGFNEVSSGSGTYYITENNVFIAKTKMDIIIGGVKYVVDLDFKGILVYSGGTGYGDYEFADTIKDSWTLSRIN